MLWLPGTWGGGWGGGERGGTPGFKFLLLTEVVKSWMISCRHHCLLSFLRKRISAGGERE